MKQKYLVTVETKYSKTIEVELDMDEFADMKDSNGPTFDIGDMIEIGVDYGEFGRNPFRVGEESENDFTEFEVTDWQANGLVL